MFQAARQPGYDRGTYQRDAPLHSMESLACKTSVQIDVQPGSMVQIRIYYVVLHHVAVTSSTGKHGVYYLIV